MYARDCASRNWVAQIKFLLCYNGFGYVWMYGCMGHEKMFITKLKNCQGLRLLLPEVVLSFGQKGMV